MWRDVQIVEPFNNYVEAYRVPSETIWKATYVVARNRAGEWNCSCPDWIFRRPESGCKHILAVQTFKVEKNIMPSLTSAAAPVELARFAQLDV